MLAKAGRLRAIVLSRIPKLKFHRCRFAEVTSGIGYLVALRSNAELLTVRPMTRLVAEPFAALRPVALARPAPHVEPVAHRTCRWPSPAWVASAGLYRCSAVRVLELGLKP